MNAVDHQIMRLMRVWVVAIAMMLFAQPQAVHAQTVDVDWADAGVGSLQAVPSGTSVSAADGTTATVTWSSQTDGGSFVPVYSSSFLSYYDQQIGSGFSPLLASFDNSAYDPDDRVIIDITLNRSVSGLEFALSDIDLGSFTDAVEVYYDNDLVGAYTNAATNTAFWTIGSSVARTNNTVVNGWRGTAGSATTATNGDIAFDFGAQQVRRIRIVYFSYTGSGDPTGQFMGISDLVFDAQFADLSLTKSLVGTAPVSGGTATWSLTVTNASNSTQTANGVVVQDTFPGGFTFGSATGDGTFNSGSGQWSVGTLAPGASATITISGTISSAAGSTVTNTAQIIASSAYDPDSTVNNGNTGEDDYASASFIVQTGRLAGIPPILSCPAGQSVFDWDTISGWTAGTTDNTYAFATFGNIRFQLSNDGAYLNNATFGGQSPTVFNAFTGGLVPAEDSLTILADQTSQTGEAETTITLPRSFTGLQFTVFDVDFNNAQFADRVEVVGFNDGASVTPTLTNGNANYVVGNQAFGDAGSNNDEGRGNVVVTFTQAVDTVIVRYGNHSAAPADPGQQGIGIHDITVCDPFAQLNVTKVSSVISDPVNGTSNPKAIPGATIEYLITVTNSGPDPADTDSVVILDNGPSDAKICLLDRNGGPIVFADPGGNSGLTYNYGGAGTPAADLGVTTDDLEFSSDGGTDFTYVPTADGENCDAGVTDFRLQPGGEFAPGSSITLRFRYIVL